MSFPLGRPVKLSFRVRRNFATRDWTSIGLRRVRAHPSKVATTAAIAGSNPSYTQGEESRIVGSDARALGSPLTGPAPSEKDWSELLWLGLIMLAIAAAATVQMMQ
jgi:hypothetical protein